MSKTILRHTLITNIFDIFVDFLIFIHFHYMKMHRLSYNVTFWLMAKTFNALDKWNMINRWIEKWHICEIFSTLLEIFSHLGYRLTNKRCILSSEYVYIVWQVGHFNLRYNWNIVESGVNHDNQQTNYFNLLYNSRIK